MNEVLQKLLYYKELVSGMVFTVIALLFSARPLEMGWRNYFITLFVGMLSCAVVLDYFATHVNVIWAAAIGFVIGYIADEVVKNVNATAPEFIREVVHDFFDWLREWIRRIFRK